MKVELEEGDVEKVSERLVSESLYHVRSSIQTTLQPMIKREVGKLFAEVIKEQVAKEVTQVFEEFNFKEMLRRRLLEEPNPHDYKNRPLMTQWIEERAYRIAESILLEQMTMQTKAFQKQLGERISIALTRDILRSALDEAEKDHNV